MNNLIQMNYNGNAIRTIDDNGQVWWVLKDVCSALGISNPSKVADRLDEDERSNFKLGRQGKCIVINESGLYSVILRCDKPEAKPFRRWITHEVLPEIRRTGCYSLANNSKRTKTWYGVTVLTSADAAERSGTTASNLRKKLSRHLRDGLDYFVLTGNSLKLFKFENRGLPIETPHILLIREEAFTEYLNK